MHITMNNIIIYLVVTLSLCVYRLFSLSLGVSLVESGDGLGQHYITPETAVASNLTDVIIVGRAILNVSACYCNQRPTVCYEGCSV